MTDDDEILDALRHISETESVEHVWKDGEYQGCSVTYKNPLLPELKTMFHPYIPLIACSVNGEMPPLPRLTRQYFLDNGLTVPGEDKIRPS